MRTFLLCDFFFCLGIVVGILSYVRALMSKGITLEDLKRIEAERK